MSFLTVCLNPTLQKTLRFPSIFPGTVNRTGVHRLDASGKGINVTRVLTQLGKKAVHLTQLGGGLRPLFLSLCEQDGLSVRWAESESQIRFCYTLLTGADGALPNGSVVTELVEEPEPVGAGTEERLLEKFNQLLAETPDLSWLIISGTKAPGFSDALIPAMTRTAKEKGLKIILDIKGKDLTESLKYEPDIVKPNLFEFAAGFAPELIRDNELTDLDESASERISSAVSDIARKYRCRVILTNGSRKIIAADAGLLSGGVFFEVEIRSVKTVNSTGCGDAFTAGLAAALEDGADLRAAISEGCRCGALNAALVRPGVIG
ncbi:MAG: PfkB family carbohydrate kinase [Treponema sp.]|jgi:fructose-1-phosphate kinase PfkB-like protein|nr:PfkB family carbohydrate kinase [Treponema sp.]